MIEEFTRNGWEDFQRRYDRTFGFFHTETGRRVLVKVVAVSPDALSMVDADGVAYTANADRGNQFEFLPVEKAVYNYKDEVILTQRQPARQWKRGICAQNTAIILLGGGRGMFDRARDVNFSFLETIFVNHSYKESVERFKKHRRASVALNEVFSIINRDSIMVYDQVIGSFFEEQNSIVLNNNLFRQEIEDTLREYAMHDMYVRVVGD